MAAHDEDDDLFADLYGDDEEDSKAPTQAPAPAAEPAPVPVPPVSIAVPIAGDASVGDVAAQLSAVTNKANDPRLAGQSNVPAPQPEPVPVPAPVSAPLPEMPQMPTPAPPQPSYNVKEDGKMFIGGLNWETTDESLKEYFEQFGTVTDCMVMRDGATGRSRGFGFLTFAEASSVTTVVAKEHYLDGKIIDPKRAVPRDEQEKTAKMFVGGVPPDCDEDQFSQFFGQFGRVVDATLMMDKDTGRPRGFGFVTFDTGEAVERAMVTPFLQINGKTIEVKRATPKGNQDRNARGAGTYNPNGGLGASQESAAAYGGMTPAMMAQYYQRMQQWMAQMQAMGRGQAAQGMMGMNPMMNPMMMQQMQQMQQMQAQGGGGGQQQGYGASPQQGGYGSQSPAQHGGGGGGGYPSHQDGQYDDNAQDGNGGEGDNQDSRPPLDAPSGPSQYRAGRGGYNNGGGGGGYQDRGGRGYDNRGGGGGRGGYQDRGRGRGRGGYRGGQSRFDPYSR